MSESRAFRELVETPWGFNVYRSVDALNWCVLKMMWGEMLNKRTKSHWRAREELERRGRAGHPKQLGLAFRKRINEQLARAELVESGRMR